MRNTQLKEEDVNQIVKRKIATGEIEQAQARKQKQKENFIIFLYFALLAVVIFIGESKTSFNAEIMGALYLIIVVLATLLNENRKKVRVLEDMLLPQQKIIYNSIKNNP